MRRILCSRSAISALCIAFISSFASGCGGTAGVGSKIAPPAIAFEQGAPASGENGSGSVSIDQFEDVRADKALADYDGRTIEATADIVPAVRAGLKDVLEKHGVIVSDSAPLVVSVEVRDWKTAVESGFNTKATGTAAVFLRVYDPGNKLIHSGLYKGEAHLIQSKIKESDISDVLATAMSEALTQVTQDKTLMKLFQSF